MSPNKIWVLPYLGNFDSATGKLKLLVESTIQKANRRTLINISGLYEDVAELGAKYNRFSLCKQLPRVAAAIEKTSQVSD